MPPGLHIPGQLAVVSFANMWTPRQLVALPVFSMALIVSACDRTVAIPDDAPSLLLALAVLDTKDGAPRPLPARLGILTQTADGWHHRFIEDSDSNVFHKALSYGATGEITGVLTLGGTEAVVKLWGSDGSFQSLWEADFGGAFSRMRDAEVGDIYGDGNPAIAVATHDQGVVAVIRSDGGEGFTVHELDREPDTVVHEIELGDLDGDGVVEIYATPTAPNQVDGTPQPGKIVRYVPEMGESRVVVADLGLRHAKEILVDDLDGDGFDELYVSVEAVSGGKVEIRRYIAGTDPAAGEIVATLDDRLCRFLTVGDVDGDGVKEMVAATMRSGLWLLKPGVGEWSTELIDDESSGFEHASILLDIDGDGRAELYVASDDQHQVRRYKYDGVAWDRDVIWEYDDGLGRFTWNITLAPAGVLPAGS
jgi:hypothetical protein